MISKENFVKYMDKLKDLSDAENELNNVLKKFNSDNILWFDKYETLIVNMLQDIFNDQKNNWIGHAIYELDWFRDYEDGMILDKNGNDISLRDAVDLYDLLVWNMDTEKKCDTCKHLGWMTMGNVAECNVCENNSNYSAR